MRSILLTVAIFSMQALAEPAETPSPAADAPPDRCQAWRELSMPEGPLTLGFYEADVATGRHACPRLEVSLGVRGKVIIDTPRFYGAIGADGLLSASVPVGSNMEVFGTLEAVHFQYVQNATLKGTALSLGQLTLGASHAQAYSPALTGTSSARIMLPTSTGSANAHTLGAELGHSVGLAATRAVDVHAYVGFDLSTGLSAGPDLVRAGGTMLAGIQWTPWRYLSVVLDMTGHLGATAYLAPALGLRYSVSKLAIELGGTLPIAGNDRHNGILGLKVSYLP